MSKIEGASTSIPPLPRENNKTTDKNNPAEEKNQAVGGEEGNGGLLESVSKILGYSVLIEEIGRTITGQLAAGISNDILNNMAPFRKCSDKALDCYSHPAYWYSFRFKDPRIKNLKPSPIFNSRVSQDFESLKKALCNATKSDAQLPHAIIHGKYGTGKSTAGEWIARGGDWNYCIFMASNFVEFLQDSDKTTEFFKVVRGLVLPTVLVIDEADGLINPISCAREKAIDPEKVKIAIQKIKEQAGIRDNKLMFLFILQDLPMDLAPDFLSRINYAISVGTPGTEELKAIIEQQAKKHLGPLVLKEFNREIVESLAKGVFEGRNGRDVESFMSCMEMNTKSIKELPKHKFDSFSKYCVSHLPQRDS